VATGKTAPPPSAPELDRRGPREQGRAGEQDWQGRQSANFTSSGNANKNVQSVVADEQESVPRRTTLTGVASGRL